MLLRNAGICLVLIVIRILIHAQACYTHAHY